MPDMTVRPQWQIRLDNEELGLVLKALGRRLGTGDFIESARILGDKLTDQKIAIQLEIGKNGQKLQQSVLEKRIEVEQ